MFPLTDPAISGDPSKLELIQTSNEEVLLILSSLETSKATGPDDLSAAILKKLCRIIASLVGGFHKYFIKNRPYYIRLETSKYSSSSQKDPRVDVTNFRPISLLSIVSKIQEKCVVRVFFPFVIKRIHFMQYGFQPGTSCASQLLEVFHKIAKSLEKGSEVDIIYPDFSKAFDSAFC